MKLFNRKIKEKRTGVKIKKDTLFDYSTTETREATIGFLFSYAKTARGSWEEYWKLMKRYYDGEHDTPKEMAAFVQSQGLPWTPTQCEEGFIAVETQIDPSIPEFEFSGRDDDQDSTKAKQREYVARYVIDNNPMELMNTRNERWLNKYGTACWKVAFNLNKKMGSFDGNIDIGNPKVTQLFFDTSAVDSIDDCVFFPIVYPMHKINAAIAFEADLKRMDKDINDFATGYGIEDTEFLKDADAYDSTTFDNPDFTVQITEWYFKQPTAGKAVIDGVEYTWESGDIGLVILINGEEIRYNPKYWRKTSCKMYPFSLYCKIPNDDYLWGKSEIEQIKSHIDTVDRKMSYAELNEAFMSNDITIIEENAVDEGNELVNIPGALWKVKPGMINSVRRLGGLTEAKFKDGIEMFKDYIQKITGNFDAYQGNEPTRVTTSSGIAMLNDRARSRQDIKKVDRKAGFERLYKLIDYTALEHFDDNRIIFLGAKSKDEPPINFTFNSDNMKMVNADGEEYYPTVDVTINVGDGLKNSKAFTTLSVKEILGIPITPENYKIVQAYIDLTGIPQRQELKRFVDEVINGKIKQMAQELANQMMQQQMAQQQQAQSQGVTMDQILKHGGFSPEDLDIIEQNPEIVHNAAQQNGLNIQV